MLLTKLKRSELNLFLGTTKKIKIKKSNLIPIKIEMGNTLVGMCIVVAALPSVLGIEVPLLGNRLCRMGSTAFRKAPSSPHYGVYEPLPRLLETPKQPLVVFVHGGGWHCGSISEQWLGGYAFMGRMLASHSSGACRTAVLEYPKCAVPVRAKLVIFCVLLAPLIGLFFVLPRLLWLLVAVPTWVFGYTLVWAQEVRTSGTDDPCRMCAGRPRWYATADRTPASHQLAHLIDSTHELIARYRPSHLVLVGHSAGGHLAAMMGVLAPRMFGDVPRISVVGLSGVYNIAGLWAQSWRVPLLGWTVRETCLRPAFGPEDTPTDTISPHCAISEQDELCLLEDMGVHTRHFHLVTARRDNPMLIAQADAFCSTLSRRGVDATRHPDVGMGHGQGLIRSAETIDLLVNIAHQSPPEN
jgi:acetyl esterase/lipase